MQFKTYFECYVPFKTKQHIWFPSKYKGLQLGPWQYQAILLCCLKQAWPWALGNNKWFWMLPAECWSSPKSTAKFAMSLGYLFFGWILTSWFTFFCHFWGIKYPFCIWEAEYFSQELSSWQNYSNRDCLVSFCYHLPSRSSQAIELVCLYKTSLMCEIPIFRCLEFSLSLEAYCLWLCPQWSLIAW